MKLKYRIKEYKFEYAKTFYTAQYKIMGIWMNINLMQTGRLFNPSSTKCESLDEAENRINTHKENMTRAKYGLDTHKTIIWKS